MKRIHLLALVCMLIVAGTAAYAQNILQDPNMDIGDGPWTRWTGHVWWGSWVNATDGQTPSNYLLTFKDSPADETTPVVAAVGQTLLNPAAGTYTASIYYRMHPGNPLAQWDGPGGTDQWANLHMDTHDGSAYTTWQESARIETSTTTWTKYTTQFVIPEGTTTARIWMQAQFIESWAMVDWDTASLAPVPEPSSLVVLFGGLAGLAGFARRRR